MNLPINYSYARAKSYSFRQQFLILHYTVGNFESSLNELTHHLSVHYLVPLSKKDDPSYPFDQLQVFSLVDEQSRAWHAGVSAFQDRVSLNDSSIGIEIVNMTHSISHFLPYPDDQIELVISLSQNILQRYPDITPERVLGHADIAFDRKIDPGPLFPWKKLYDAGIGAWYTQEDVDYFTEGLKKKKYSLEQAFTSIQAYGYGMNRQKYPDGLLDKKNLVRAFQMHFRPSNYDGTLDIETAAIMLALYRRYTAKPDDLLLAGK